MGKRKYGWDWNTYHRRIAEGRGRGTLKDYLPWLTIHDLASLGVVSRVMGRTAGRIYHLLSGLETAFFYILDASDLTLDIWEQYPLLPLEDTLRIAEAMRIRHPRDNNSKYPIVLTSDFVVTTTSGLKVLSVKPSSELEKLRTREKLALEHRFWEEKGIEWRLVTEKEIDFQKARNLEWINRSWDFCERVPEGRNPDEILDAFQYIYEHGYDSVSRIAEIVENRFKLEPGFGITTYQHLVLRKRIHMDLSNPPDIVTPRIDDKKGGKISWIRTYA